MLPVVLFCCLLEQPDLTWVIEKKHEREWFPPSLHTQPNNPQSLPVHRRFMGGTWSTINTCYSARVNQALCKICEWCWWQWRWRRRKRTRRWHEFVIFTKIEATSGLFSDVDLATDTVLNKYLFNKVIEGEEKLERGRERDGKEENITFSHIQEVALLGALCTGCLSESPQQP